MRPGPSFWRELWREQRELRREQTGAQRAAIHRQVRSDRLTVRCIAMKEINWNEVPDILTKEQFYKLCHISKKTARFLLESGKLQGNPWVVYRWVQVKRKTRTARRNPTGASEIPARLLYRAAGAGI